MQMKFIYLAKVCARFQMEVRSPNIIQCSWDLVLFRILHLYSRSISAVCTETQEPRVKYLNLL